MTTLMTNRSQFPEHGMTEEQLRASLADQRRSDLPWTDPRNMRASFFGGEDVARLARDAYAEFQGENLLYGKTLYPSIAQMSAEIVDMALEILQAPRGATGTFTTGGTESNIMSVKTARDWARVNRKTPSTPEILMGHTCHASFNKAADMMGIKAVRLPPNASYQVDVDAMREHINENTIMLIGSAPAYPFGCIDDITSIAALAKEHGLWMHVDGCVGGFLLPFIKDVEDVPPFDFAVDGVRSMSADLHKYGFTSNGASLLLLADGDDEKYQRFDFNEWAVGEFPTSTIGGTKPGGAAASAWTILHYLGREGYRERAKKIVDARRAFVAEIEKMEELTIFGKPSAGFVGFGGAPGTDMRAVRQGMIDKGWSFASLVEPVGINLLLNCSHADVVDSFAADLRKSIQESKN